MLLRAFRPTPRPRLQYRRIVVPLAEGDEWEHSVALAAELASEQGGSLIAVVVIELPAELPLDAQMLEEEAAARRVLEQARAIAGSFGVRVRARVVRGRRPGEAIVAEAKALGADLVLLRTRPAHREAPFGKTVDYVLKHAPCRVLLDSPPSRS